MENNQHLEHFDLVMNNERLLHQERIIAIQEESIERRLLVAQEGLRMRGWTDTSLKVYTDGTDEKGTPMWCAMIGPNIQEGYAGFHVDKLQAKERLLADIQNPEITLDHTPDANAQLLEVVEAILERFEQLAFLTATDKAIQAHLRAAIEEAKK